MENTQRRVYIEEPIAESSIISQRTANTAPKPTNWKKKFDEEIVVDQTKFTASERLKVNPSSKSCYSEV
jgi:hypothetical protein